jgi:hypothetical protein
MRSEVYMNFQEALEEGYLIVVADGTLARILSSIYKNGKFASINSDQSRFDGVRGIFIDQFIADLERVNELEKYHHNVFVGPLYSDIKPAKYTIEINDPADPPKVFVDGKEIKHISGIDFCYETKTHSEPGCHQLNLTYFNTDHRGHTHMKTDGFNHGINSPDKDRRLPPSVTVNIDTDRLVESVVKTIEKVEHAKQRRTGQ